MPRPELRRLAGTASAGAIFLALALGAGAALAETGKRDPAAVKREIGANKARAAALAKKAKAIEAEMARLRVAMIRTARDIQEREATLTGLEEKLDRLEAKERALRTRLGGRERKLSRILAALQRLSLNPPEAMVAYPADANRTVRSAILLRHYIPHLERQVAPVRRELAAIARVRGGIVARKAEIETASRALASERTRLAGLLGRSTTMHQQTESEREAARRRLKRLTGKARNLGELAKRVEAEARPAQIAARPKLPPPRMKRPARLRAFSNGRGRIAKPVRGRVVRRFGEQTSFGSFTKGIEIRTRRGAQVVAPFDGRVVFAGPFRDYGQILIIEHTEGYHTLLAGLTRIDIVLNQWLLSGEPVGAMSSTQSRRTRLYMEIRRKGQSINPLPWLAATSTR